MMGEPSLIEKATIESEKITMDYLEQRDLSLPG